MSDTRRELETATDIEDFAAIRYTSFSPRKLMDALRSGSRIGIPRSGVLQGRSTFVVEPGGSIVYAHHSTTAADVAPVGDLLESLRTIQR